jgi:hypothetical protein
MDTVGGNVRGNLEALPFCVQMAKCVIYILILVCQLLGC